MKLYKESFRRLNRIGLTLLIVSIVLTTIITVQNCIDESGGYNGARICGLFTFMPVMLYYVFAAGVGFALAGFSFLNKRAESDFYHSIPVRRSELFLSISAASMTWIFGTIVINALLSMVVYLSFGVPFVPAYVPMGALFFAAAALLVFAATSIACSLTGTLLTNIAVTCIVLFLPRFVLFLIARSLVDYTTLMSWLDMPRWIRPDMNAATGMIVMFSRTAYNGTIMNWGTILYSLLLGLAELGCGCLLFMRRPSELAEQGARSTAWQNVFACALTLPVLLLILVPGRRNPLISMFTLIVIAAGLAVYVVYQLVVLRNAKRMLKSLPWFVGVAVVSFAMLFIMRSAGKAQLNRCPAWDEIAYVEFPGGDASFGSKSYSTLTLQKGKFSSKELRQLVAETLYANVENANQQADGYYNSYFYNQLSSIEPVVIHLQNGQKLRRTLLFANVNELNELRTQYIDTFNAATHTLPDKADIKKYASYYGLSQAELRQLFDCFAEECTELELIPYNAYRVREVSDSDKYMGYNCDESQNYGEFNVGGYIGTARFSDYFNISLQTPKTASLWMMIQNNRNQSVDLSALVNAYSKVKQSTNENDYFNVNMTVTNTPMESGRKQQMYFGYNINGGLHTMDSEYTAGIEPFATECMGLLQRGTITSDATAFNVAVSWGARCGSEQMSQDGQVIYLGFSAADTKQLLQLFRMWNVTENSTGRGATLTDAIAG